MKFGNLFQIPQKGTPEEFFLGTFEGPDQNADPVDCSECDRGFDDIIEDDLGRGTSCKEDEKWKEKESFFHPQRALETPALMPGRNALSFLLGVANEYPYPSAL